MFPKFHVRPISAMSTRGKGTITIKKKKKLNRKSVHLHTFHYLLVINYYFHFFHKKNKINNHNIEIFQFFHMIH